MHNYTLKRSKRKTISITVSDSGAVIVSAPLQIDKDYLDQTVLKKSPCISSKLEIINARIATAKPKQVALWFF